MTARRDRRDARDGALDGLGGPHADRDGPARPARARAGRSATSARGRASSSTSTSRSSAGSRAAPASASAAAHAALQPQLHRRRRQTPQHRRLGVRPRRRRRRQPPRLRRGARRREGDHRDRLPAPRGRLLSPATASPSSASSPTTAPPTARPSTRSPAARSGSATSAPAPTGRRPTAKPNASSAPCSAAGPTAPSTAQASERTAALDGWLWHYNHRRRHSALGHQPPVTRTNLLGSPAAGSARATLPSRVPALVDTTIRLLSQEPLAGRMPTADLLRLAELLDGAGFAYLEVSGGGVFDTAVRRGVESPWERIRALKARTKTPLGMALRGRFLVGSRPVGGDFARRFVASAAESGIDVFRLEDPLNDVSNLREAGEAIVAAEREFDAGLIYSPGRAARRSSSSSRRRSCPISERRASSCTTRPEHSSRTGPTSSSPRSPQGSGLPVGLYCQGAGGSGLASALEAARAGADLIACAVYPIALTLHRVSGEGLASALAGAGMDSGVDVEMLWQAAEIVDEFIGDDPVTPLAPHIAVRAAQHELPAGLVAAIDTRLRAHGATDRLDDVLERAGRDPRRGRVAARGRADRTDPRLAGDRPRPVRDPLPDRRRRAARPARRTLRDAAGRDRPDRAACGLARLRGRQPTDEPAPDLDAIRDDADGLAASEEELLLLALFGEEAEPLLQRDPRPLERRGLAARRRSRPDAGRADPRDRAHRPGDRDRRDRCRGRGDARLGPAHRGAGPARGSAPEPAADEPEAAPAEPPAEPADRRRDPRRGADGRHVLPRAAARRAAVRRRRRRGGAGPDALHPRGDEADERGQGRDRGRRPHDPRPERSGRRVRPGALRPRARARPPAGRL